MIEKYAGTLTGMFARKVLQKGRENAKLRALVDSQAQKNEKLLAENNVLAILVDELKADREGQAVRLEKVESLYAIARTQIEEQAKGIERLKKIEECATNVCRYEGSAASVNALENAIGW